MLMSAAFILGACGPLSRSAQSGQAPRSLLVNNRTSFEIVLYAVPATGATGIRLGTAGAFATTRIQVPRTALQGSDGLVVRLHTFGSATSARDWESPRITLGDDLVAKLDIRIDSYGDLSSSLFFAAPSDSGSAPRGGPPAP
jgi:hypothetical protein